jgi:Ser/Thr protein kinase RdoA (MazF antagonist)
LRALRQRCGLAVPEPVPTGRGELLVEASCPGIPQPRNCSLLRWIRGRRLGGRAVVRHYAAQGRLMAIMHAFAERWHWSGRAKPRRYDWDGLFRQVPALCLPVDNVWSLLPKAYSRPFRRVTGRVRRAMDYLGSGPDAFGLIHADLGVDANLLFWQGQPRPIDFDELGLGYWIYDLAVALEHCRGHRDYLRNRDALLAGYAEVRKLPAEQLRYLDLFMAALDVHLGLWANAVVTMGSARDAVRRRLRRYVGMVERYLESGAQHRLELSG